MLARLALDAGLDLDGVRLDPPLPAGAAAVGARLLDHGAVAAAARAGLREREEALALGPDAAAVALGADHGSRAGLRAGAAALAAGGRRLDGHLGLGAAQRVLEREVHQRLDVVAAQRLPLRAHAPRTAAAAPPEEPAEQVAEVAEVEVAEVDGRPGDRKSTRLNSSHEWISYAVFC